MDRQKVYELIDKERKAMDEVWRRGRANEAQYKFAAPHVLLIEENADKLRKLWYVSKKEDMKDRLVKIAAIAVRALEEVNVDTSWIDHPSEE